MAITMLILINLFTLPWDTLFLDLPGAVDYALINNPEIRDLALDLDLSKLKVDEATADFLPSLTASGYYSYISYVPVIENGNVRIQIGQHDNYNVQLSLQQVIFTWGRFYDAYRFADIGKKIASLTLARKRQEIRYAVTQSFYGLLVLQEMVKVTGESYAQLKRHEDAVRKRYEAGLAVQFELLRAQVQVANLKPRLTEVENNLLLARNGFQMLLGMPLDQAFGLAGELGLIDTADYELANLNDSALANRAEIRNLENAEKMGQLARTMIGRSNLPSIAAGATYAYKNPAGLTDNGWGGNLTLNVGFNWPLFSGFKNLARYRAATVNMKRARLAVEEVKKAVTIEVKNAYATYQAAREASVAARENLDQADQALVMIDNRYKNGLATNLEYLDVELARMQAKTNYLNALKDYHTARAAIDRAVGKE
jgi:outer membrane protein TolC